MQLLPKQFGDTVVTMATFAFDHLQPSHRWLCVFIAQGNSRKPRWIAFPANTDEEAARILQADAKLSPADAGLIVKAAHETRKELERTAGQFIPAGATR